MRWKSDISLVPILAAMESVTHMDVSAGSNIVDTPSPDMLAEGTQGTEGGSAPFVCVYVCM